MQNDLLGTFINVALEQYCFSPKDVLKTITIEQYLVFLIYALEYRALVLEQLSHEAEKQWLKDHENDLQDGYGVILLDFTIRDMKGESATFFWVNLKLNDTLTRSKHGAHWCRRQSSCSRCFKRWAR